MPRMTKRAFEAEYHAELEDFYTSFCAYGRSVFGEDFFKQGGDYYTFVTLIYETSVL